VAAALTASLVGALGASPWVVTVSTLEGLLVPSDVMVETLKQYLVPGFKLLTFCAKDLDGVLLSTVYVEQLLEASTL
jgi:hypothetical protein